MRSARAADAGHVRDLVERVVGLRRQVDRRRAAERREARRSPYSGKARVSASDHRRQVRFRAAAREGRAGRRPAGRTWPPATASVCRSISLAAGDVRQVASCGLYAATSVSAITEADGHARVEEPEIARMRDLHLPPPHHRFDVGDDRLERRPAWRSRIATPGGRESRAASRPARWPRRDVALDAPATRRRCRRRSWLGRQAQEVGGHRSCRTASSPCRSRR